jgi:lipopolysaccharide biosynthesis regulator YciM
MAEAHHALGRDASARAMVQRALAKDPKDKRGNLLAAKLEDARGNVAGAISHYRKVLSVDADNATATKYLQAHGETP